MIMMVERQRPAIPSQRPHRARLRFERLPGAYCHPDRIGRLLPEGLPVSFRDRLQASPRLRLRLSALLARRYQLETCNAADLATPEGCFAQLEGEELMSAVRCVGAIWHARAIRKVILTEPLRRLIERLGRNNHRAALRFIDLSPDDNDPNEGADSDHATPDIEALLNKIERDGLIAVNAWRRHQPVALAERLRLKLPPGSDVDDEPPASHRDHGLMIVDRVVMTLAAEPQEEASDHG